MKKRFLIFAAIFVIVVAGVSIFASLNFFNRGNEINENIVTPESQQYITYESDDFSINYPYWPNINEKDIVEMERVRVAVADMGCNFVITVTQIPEGQTFAEYINSLLKEQTTQYNVKIIMQDIKSNTARIEGEMQSGEATSKTVSYSFLTTKNTIYAVALMAEKNRLESVCRGFFTKAIATVEVK
jgi:hypothetical protein